MAFCGLPSLAHRFISPRCSFGHPSFVPVDHHQHVRMNHTGSAGLGHITNALLFRQLGISQADLSTKPEHVGRCLDTQMIEGSRCGCCEVDRRACLFPAGLGWVFLAGVSREGFQKVILRPNQETSLSYETRCSKPWRRRDAGWLTHWPVTTSSLAHGTSSPGGINRTKPRAIDILAQPSACPGHGRIGGTSALSYSPVAACRRRQRSHAGIRSLVVAYGMSVKTLREGKREMFVKRANSHHREATSTEVGFLACQRCMNMYRRLDRSSAKISDSRPWLNHRLRGGQDNGHHTAWRE